jgi:small subunit ribosomal protein S13
MIYLFGSNLSETKSIFFALSSIHGLGKKTCIFICKKLGFSVNLKIKDLSREQLNKLIFVIESLELELGSELKKLRSISLKRLISIKSYKGFRRNQGFQIFKLFFK